jgi:predicted TIM-barrel fold metal-dependent hydrolase
MVLVLICSVLPVGPSIEAFGYERILFGSSSPRASSAPSKAGDWYGVARETIAEIGLEQEAVDCVFSANAEAVYGRK